MWGSPWWFFFCVGVFRCGGGRGGQPVWVTHASSCAAASRTSSARTANALPGWHRGSGGVFVQNAGATPSVGTSRRWFIRCPAQIAAPGWRIPSRVSSVTMPDHPRGGLVHPWRTIGPVWVTHASSCAPASLTSSARTANANALPGWHRGSGGVFVQNAGATPSVGTSRRWFIRCPAQIAAPGWRIPSRVSSVTMPDHPRGGLVHPWRTIGLDMYEQHTSHSQVGQLHVLHDDITRQHLAAHPFRAGRDPGCRRRQRSGPHDPETTDAVFGYDINTTYLEAWERYRAVLGDRLTCRSDDRPAPPPSRWICFSPTPSSNTSASQNSPLSQQPTRFHRRALVRHSTQRRGTSRQLDPAHGVVRHPGQWPWTWTPRHRRQRCRGRGSKLVAGMSTRCPTARPSCETPSPPAYEV